MDVFCLKNPTAWYCCALFSQYLFNLWIQLAVAYRNFAHVYMHLHAINKIRCVITTSLTVELSRINHHDLCLCENRKEGRVWMC